MRKIGIYSQIPSVEERRKVKSECLERVIEDADNIVDKMSDDIMRACRDAGLTPKETEEVIDETKIEAEALATREFITKAHKIDKKFEEQENRGEEKRLSPR